jgi:iron complex outermembrane receptor protein
VQRFPLGRDSTYGATLRASYTLGDGQLLPGASLTYIGSFDRYQMHDYQDIDGTDAPFLLYFPVAAPSGIDSGARINGHFHARSITQELRLTSPAGQHLRYTFGLWYARNSLDRLLDRGPVLQYIRYLATSHNENYSFYTDLSYDLTRKITLNGGLVSTVSMSITPSTITPPRCPSIFRAAVWTMRSPARSARII